MKISSLLVVGALLTLLTGCAGAAADSGNAAEPEDSSPSQPAPAPAPAPAPTTVVDDPAQFAAAPNDLDAADWQGVHFVSPSKNEGCAILGPEAAEPGLWGCALAAQDWAFPRADPADYCYDAQISCGYGIEVTGDDEPHPRRRGDPGFPAAITIFSTTDDAAQIKTLEYGHSVSYGDVTCVSAEAGISCSDSASGHGFTVSRASYELH